MTKITKNSTDSNHKLTSVSANLSPSNVNSTFSKYKLTVSLRTNVIGNINFELNDDQGSPIENSQALTNKVFETFGVRNVALAEAAFFEVFNCLVSSVKPDNPNLSEILNQHSKNVMAMFQEMQPRDAFELMMIQKMLVLHIMSNKEFVSVLNTTNEDLRCVRQSRAIKLSRLFLEFKDKFDKHRRPAQEINVQHNYIHNQGQAIIGSKLGGYN